MNTDTGTFSDATGYKLACIVLMVLPYFLFFGDAGNFSQGADGYSLMALDVFAVLGAYASIELARKSDTKKGKIAALSFGLPLFLMVSGLLYVALTKYYLNGTIFS